MRKKSRLSVQPVITTIEKFSHDGRGIARIGGKITFIEGALPTETIRFQYLRQKKDFDEGQLLTVIEPSKNRVEPRCSHYSKCGGCSLQHLDGAEQIQEKEQLLLDVLLRVGHVQPDAVLPALSGELWHYRNKARLSVRYVEKKQSTLVGFREKNNPRYITEITQCPVLNARVDAEIINIRRMLDDFAAPKSIAQIEVAAGDDDLGFIFRNLSGLSAQDEQRLKDFSDRSNIRIFLQPDGLDSIYLLHPKEVGEYLTYQLPEDQIIFKFHPMDFTQVNGRLNRLMIRQAIDLLALDSSDVVLDLFCGLGNFSLPIAKRCKKVIGVEGSEKMVFRAKMNALDNQITNVYFLNMDLDTNLVFKELNRKKVSKVLLDPPRTGALAIVSNIDQINPERLIYVSCNPATLARDAGILVHQHGFKMRLVGVIDMFPHTTHVESIALFER